MRPDPRSEWRSRLSQLVLVLTMAVLAYCARDPVLWYGFVGSALFCCVPLYILWRQGTVTVRNLLFLALILRLMLVWLPPVLSDDSYRYVWDGMLQVEGINPYLLKPEDPALARFHGEEIYGLLNSPGYYSVYPPVSQLIFAVGGLFYERGWVVSYYVIKGILILFEFGAVLVLTRLVAARHLIWYAWNPLVVVESAGQAHTEAVVVFAVVVSIWLVRRRHILGAVIAITVATWVKLYPVFFFPLLLRRFGWRAVWAPVVCTVLLWFPYADVRVPAHIGESLDLYVRLFEFNAGPYYAVKQLYLFATGTDWSKMLGPAFRAAFFWSLAVIYIVDKAGRWPLEKAYLWIIGGFLVFATTVHPWYLLGVLALATFSERPSWHWIWLGVLSIGTYLLYVSGPYWWFVILGWGGWAALGFQRYAPGTRAFLTASLRGIQQIRARRKVLRLIEFYPLVTHAHSILDLGAGEGYVGQILARSIGARVTAADVLPLNQTDLDYILYDGRSLPFEDGAFEVTVLYFVLHHANDQEAVLREALRVTSRAVLIVESVYTSPVNRMVLTTLDKLANRLRSRGMMKSMEGDLHFRTAEGWKRWFESRGVPVTSAANFGWWLHYQASFVLEKKDAV
jgi:SAM-dependent methyltransferase